MTLRGADMSMNPDKPSGEKAEDALTSAIRQLVEEAQDAQFDIQRFIPLHTPETVIVNFGGRRVLGQDALRDAMEAALGTPLANVATTTEVHDIRFVRPDVAIVSCTKHVFDGRETGAEPRPSRGSLTYVVVDEGGTWRIALAQTTPIA